VELKSGIITSCVPAPVHASPWPASHEVTTSYVVNQLKAAMIPCEHLDVYCFHPADAAELGIRPSDVITEALAALRRLPGGVGKAIKSIRLHTQGFNVPALATNIPTLSSPRRRDRLIAVEALRCLGEVAVEIGAVCVEAVGGGDFLTWPVGNRLRFLEVGPYALRARRTALAVSLQEIGEFYSRLAAKRQRRISFALELEPGPSYLSSSLESINDILEVCKGLPVGLNLDIGHALRIQRMWPSLLGDWITLHRGRTVHAHISRHTSIHGMDLPLREDADLPVCKPWIMLYRDAYVLAGDIKPTGVIAVELEACFRPESIQQSVVVLNKWFHRPDLQL